jgi:hypothetical protein
MHKPDFLDRFDRLVAFDAETTGKRTPAQARSLADLHCLGKLWNCRPPLIDRAWMHFEKPCHLNISRTELT